MPGPSNLVEMEALLDRRVLWLTGKMQEMAQSPTDATYDRVRVAADSLLEILPTAIRMGQGEGATAASLAAKSARGQVAWREAQLMLQEYRDQDFMSYEWVNRLRERVESVPAAAGKVVSSAVHTATAPYTDQSEVKQQQIRAAQSGGSGVIIAIVAGVAGLGYLIWKDRRG